MSKALYSLNHATRNKLLHKKHRGNNAIVNAGECRTPNTIATRIKEIKY